MWKNKIEKTCHSEEGGVVGGTQIVNRDHIRGIISPHAREAFDGAEATYVLYGSWGNICHRH